MGATVVDWWHVTKRPANATVIRTVDADRFLRAADGADCDVAVTSTSVIPAKAGCGRGLPAQGPHCGTCIILPRRWHDLRGLQREIDLSVPFTSCSCTSAALIHTRLSWNAPPPFGAGWSQPVSVLMPCPSSKDIVRPDRFGDQHTAALAGVGLGVDRHHAARTAEFHFLRHPRAPAPSGRQGGRRRSAAPRASATRAFR
jgi:hypothetical protein